MTLYACLIAIHGEGAVALAVAKGAKALRAKNVDNEFGLWQLERVQHLLKG